MIALRGSQGLLCVLVIALSGCEALSNVSNRNVDLRSKCEITYEGVIMACEVSGESAKEEGMDSKKLDKPVGLLK